MRKSALLLATLMVVSAPTLAFAAKKNAAPAAPAKYSTTPANANESSARVVRDGLSQIFVPAQSLAKGPVAAKPAAPAAKPKKAKKAKPAKAKAEKKKK